MSSIRWNKNDPHIYLQVNTRWYRYDCSLPPVGSGAMGLVYLGFDCATNEKVAVKMLRQEYWNDAHIRKRLKLEASIQACHPNIVRMIGFCEDQSCRGPLYVLSEYVCGVTFSEHMQQLSYWNKEDKYDKIVGEFLPVLDAVGCLHSHGIIHRDIKPSNIMFQDGYLLKLMDLGIAKAGHFFDAHQKGFIGTQPFAAPEQCVDDNVEAKIDERSDIYSIGVTLSYLLADHFPLVRTDKVPLKVMNIIHKATEPDPALRYNNTDEMRTALEDYIGSGGAGKNVLLKYLPVISVLIVLAILIKLILQ